MQKNGAGSGGDEAPATSRRGRPRQFDREAALAQATRVFWSKGYEATSISDLTKAMGIGSPSLYAAFGSKEALYAEALQHYARKYAPLFWDGFNSAATAREAFESYLLDSAAVLTGSIEDIPLGCMIVLSSVDSEEHLELAKLVKSDRNASLTRLKERVARGVAEGEVPASTDVHALARFMQTVQNGMSILARDGASRAELEDVAQVAMLGWDARTGRGRKGSSVRC
jgi:AcrR family transcriptional regulator